MAPAGGRGAAVLKRVRPAVWLAVVWAAVTAYPLCVRLSTHGAPLGSGAPTLGPMLAVAAATVAGTALVRRRPLSALALLLTGTVISTAALSVMDIPLLEFLPVDLAVCFIAATRPRRTSVPGAGLALGVLGGYTAARSLLDQPTQQATVLVVGLTGIVAWLIGDSIRQSHVHAEEVRAQAAAQAVTAERLRIARELHDMVAHSIGVIAIQAGVGSRVIETQPAEARAALSTIEATSRETLAGLRRTVSGLRRADPVPLGPAPGLAELDRLAAATLDAGVRVEVRRYGDGVALPADIDLAAYRIVQEALTNVVRHAGVGDCRVTVSYSPTAVVLRVEDDGRGATAPAGAGAGYGLPGMRERAALVGGTLASGPGPEGGFHITATLPLP